MSVLPKSAPHAHEAQRRPWAYTGYTHAEKAEVAYSLAQWRLDGSGQCEIREARTVSRSAFPSPSTNLLYSTSQSPFSAFTIVAVAQASEKPSSEDRTSTLSPEANFFSSFMGGCGQRSVRASKFGKVEHLRRGALAARTRFVRPQRRQEWVTVCPIRRFVNRVFFSEKQITNAPPG